MTKSFLCSLSLSPTTLSINPNIRIWLIVSLLLRSYINNNSDPCVSCGGGHASIYDIWTQWIVHNSGDHIRNRCNLLVGITLTWQLYSLHNTSILPLFCKRQCYSSHMDCFIVWSGDISIIIRWKHRGWWLIYVRCRWKHCWYKLGFEHLYSLPNHLYANANLKICFFFGFRSVLKYYCSYSFFFKVKFFDMRCKI